jgi:hypothetical protein
MLPPRAFSVLMPLRILSEDICLAPSGTIWHQQIISEHVKKNVRNVRSARKLRRRDPTTVSKAQGFNCSQLPQLHELVAGDVTYLGSDTDHFVVTS